MKWFAASHLTGRELRTTKEAAYAADPCQSGAPPFYRDERVLGILSQVLVVVVVVGLGLFLCNNMITGLRQKHSAATFEVLEDGPVVTDWLVSLCRQLPVGGIQIHDANIVATMLAHGERRLLTFNVAAFRRYADHIE